MNRPLLVSVLAHLLVVALRLHGIRSKADSIIGDTEFKIGTGVIQRDLNVPGLGVLDGVGDSFLRDAKQVMFMTGRQCPGRPKDINRDCGCAGTDQTDHML